MRLNLEVSSWGAAVRSFTMPSPHINRGFIMDSVGLPDAVHLPLFRLGHMAETGVICEIHEKLRFRGAGGNGRRHSCLLLLLLVEVGARAA